MYSLQSPLTLRAFFGMSAAALVAVDDPLEVIAPPDVPEAASVGLFEDDAVIEVEDDEDELPTKEPLVPARGNKSRSETLQDK